MRILVVEDEQAMADAIALGLTKNGYAVDTVYDGEDGLDYAMTEAGGASEFVREYTLASGGPYCDCGYRKKQTSA